MLRVGHVPSVTVRTHVLGDGNSVSVACDCNQFQGPESGSLISVARK